MPGVSKIEILGPYTAAELSAQLANLNLSPHTVIFISDGGDGNGQFYFWTGTTVKPLPAENPFYPGTVFAGSIDVASSNVLINSAGIQMGGILNLADAGASLQCHQGTDIASSNNLTLSGGNAFEITGTTQINAISTAGLSMGITVTLLFASTPTVKHNTAGGGGTAPILLAGAVDFVASAGDTLTLLLCDIGGTQAWREIGRAVI